MKISSLPLALMLAVMITVTAAGTPSLEKRVTLKFDKTPIAGVLKLLAAEQQMNLVLSSAVEGNISISLTDVDFFSALNAILLPNGYDYVINDNIIIVKSADQPMIGELTPKTYRLKFMQTTTAEGAIKPLLSPKGQVTSLNPPAPDQKTAVPGSELVVTDIPAVHGLVVRLLDQIDIKQRQVSVEVKIIETNLSGDEKLGINWPKSIGSSITGIASPGQSTQGSTSNASQAAVMPLETGDWQLGYLTVQEVTAVLNFLQQRNNSKLLSNPRLTTQENTPAMITVQTVVPIQTINRFSEGAVVQDIVTFQDKEIGISLKVTPRINADNSVTMQVNPVVEEIIDYVGPTNNQRPVTSQRSVLTTVTVANNETVALGGLLKETKFETEDRIFFLGSIPVLGKVFTNKTTKTGTTDLLIMITPKILD